MHVPSPLCSSAFPLCPFQNKTYSTLDTGYSEMGDEWKNAKSVYEFNVKDINGQDVSMEKYKYDRPCAVHCLPPKNPVKEIVTAQ